MANKKKIPLGVKNKNPGNIKGKGWLGQTDSDKYGHAIFSSPEFGWRALVKNTITRGKRNPEETIQSYVDRYANEASAWIRKRYGSRLAKALGAKTSGKITDYSPVDIAAGMGPNESGIKMSPYNRIRAIEMLNKELGLDSGVFYPSIGRYLNRR